MFFVLCYCVRRLHVTRCCVREEQQLVYCSKNRASNLDPALVTKY
jgi:hypothetical protein